MLRRNVVFNALPLSLVNVKDRVKPRQLDLTSHTCLPNGALAAELFAAKASERSQGSLQIDVEVVVPTMPLAMISKASALAVYSTVGYSNVEPVLGLSALPMFVSTFDEAEALAQIAKPHYSAALARHSQILLATHPWRPSGLWSTLRLRSIDDFQNTAFKLDNMAYIGERFGWEKLFIRLGMRRASYSEAEVMLSAGTTSNLKLGQEFSFFHEIFLASPLDFLTVSREVFDSLSAAQRQDLIGAGHEVERELWAHAREEARRDQQSIAARGVQVVAQPPADLLAALRMAAEVDVRRWTASLGEDGLNIIAAYRQATGRIR